MDSHLDWSSEQNVGSNATSLDDSQFVKATPPVEPSKKRTRSASLGSSTPGSYESHHDDATEGPTSEDRGTDSVSPEDNPFMKALEYMWAKRKEAEALKEMRRQERHDKIMDLEMKKLELAERKLHLQQERHDEIMALEKKKLELEERELDLQQWIQDNKVMSMDISSMSGQQQQYYTRRQEEIFARRFGVGSS
ncbi:hypothetical protein ACP70R_003060 [Stipagrostis hirtigluma subsp. patula]